VQGLIKSKYFVLLVSKAAWANFTNLQADTPKERIDNVFLEYRLALELKRKGKIKKIIPVWVGEVEPDAGGQVAKGGGRETISEPIFGDFFCFADGALVNVPKVKDEAVLAVEAEVEFFLQQFNLGTFATRPEERTVDAVLKRIMRFQGPKLYTKGGETFTFESAVTRIKNAVQDDDEAEEEEQGNGAKGELPLRSDFKETETCVVA